MRRVLVLIGDGINSHRELSQSFTAQGAEVREVLVNEFLQNPNMLENFQLFALPGGFSFGDELRSGKILAEKMRKVLEESLPRFLDRDGRILGICNGFQVLAQWGILDSNPQKRSFTLAHNEKRRFINRWVELKLDTSSPWFHRLSDEIYLPIRHGEGRVVLKNSDLVAKPIAWYKENVNGSWQEIAALMSPDQKVLGMMPHPEVATHDFLHPFREGSEKNALFVQQFFKNALS